MSDEAHIHVNVMPAEPHRPAALLLSAFVGGWHGVSVSVGLSPERAEELAADLLKGAALARSGTATKAVHV